MTVQEKWMKAADTIAADHGLELIHAPNYANTGSVSLQREDSLTPLATITYNFQNGWKTASFGGDINAHLSYDRLQESLDKLRDIASSAVAA